MNQYLYLEISQRSEALFVTLNRPEFHNAFDERMIAELTHVFGTINERQDVRFVVLTGKGRTFCAGADLTMMKAAAEYDHEQNVAEAETIFDLMLAIRTLKDPNLIAVEHNRIDFFHQL